MATPLGHLGDVTLRALEALRECRAVICEDTRRTAKLLAHYGIHRPLLSMPAFEEQRRVAPLLARLHAGERLTLVSDAGSVGISDPGERLIAAAIEAGIAVEVCPGPSAAIAALQISGLPTGRFTFAGFIPRKGKERTAALAELAPLRSTLILYESPRRLGATLSELRAVLGDRRAVVVRELTKIHEEVARGLLSQLEERFSGEVLGEVTLLVEGQQARERPLATATDVQAALTQHAAAGLRTRELAKLVGEELGLPSNVVYAQIVKGPGRSD